MAPLDSSYSVVPLGSAYSEGHLEPSSLAAQLGLSYWVAPDSCSAVHPGSLYSAVLHGSSVAAAAVAAAEVDVGVAVVDELGGNQ